MNPTNDNFEDPKQAFEFACYTIQGRWEASERVVLTSPQWACEYAMYVIKDRWEEAEPIIATSNFYSLKYAREVLSGRFPAGEPAIFSDPRTTINYLKDFNLGDIAPESTKMQIAKGCINSFDYAKAIKGRFPEGESVISGSNQEKKYSQLLRKYHPLEFPVAPSKEQQVYQTSEYPMNLVEDYICSLPIIHALRPDGVEVNLTTLRFTYHYALHTQNKGFENIFACHAGYAYWYALNVLKGKFKDGEAAIATNAWCSYRYAVDVLNKYFLPGEKAMAQDEQIWKAYKKVF